MSLTGFWNFQEEWDHQTCDWFLSNQSVFKMQGISIPTIDEIMQDIGRFIFAFVIDLNMGYLSSVCRIAENSNYHEAIQIFWKLHTPYGN